MTENVHCDTCSQEDYSNEMPCKLESLVPDFDMEIYDPKSDEVYTKNITDCAGKWSVLFFYPADFTFVCPTELKDLNEKYDEITKYNTDVFVVSTDTVFSHKRRVETESLLKDFKIPMVADRTQDLSILFNALNEDTGNSERAIIVISPEWVVKVVEMTTEPLWRNASELLRKIKALDYMTKNPWVACQASWNEETTKQLKPGINIAGHVGEALS